MTIPMIFAIASVTGTILYLLYSDYKQIKNI